MVCQAHAETKKAMVTVLKSVKRKLMSKHLMVQRRPFLAYNLLILSLNARNDVL